MAGSSTVSNASLSNVTTSNINSLLSKTSTTVSSATSGVGSVVNGATSAVSSTVSAVKSEVSSVTQGITDTVSSAVSGVGNLLNQAEKSVAGGVSDFFSSVFGDTSSKTGGAVNTVIPDALGSSFKGGTPKSQFFSTNPINSDMQSVNFSGQSSTSTFGLSSLTNSISTLSNRFGSDVTSGISGITSSVSSFIKSSGVSGLYTDLTGAVKSVSSTVGAITSSVSTIENTVSSAAAGAISDFQNLAGPVVQSITGSVSGFNSLINTNLPLIATSNGSAISGAGNNVSSTTLTSMYAAAKSLGCDITNLPYTAYSAEKNLFGALLGITSQLNMSDLLRQLLNCNHFDSYGASVAQTLFLNNAGSNAGVAAQLGSAIGRGRMTATKALTTSVVTNPNLVPSDTSNVQTILSTMGSGASALQTGGTVGTQPIWDSTVTGSTPSYIIDALSGSSSLSSISTGDKIDVSSAFASI